MAAEAEAAREARAKVVLFALTVWGYRYGCREPCPHRLRLPERTELRYSFRCWQLGCEVAGTTTEGHGRRGWGCQRGQSQGTVRYWILAPKMWGYPYSHRGPWPQRLWLPERRPELRYGIRNRVVSARLRRLMSSGRLRWSFLWFYQPVCWIT